MQPSVDELRVAIGQILKAQDDFPFRGDVGFGTALPYCFDERLIERGMQANCGVGTWFSAITNTGEFRLCNQSRMSFGNVLQKAISDIWLDPRVDTHFRALRWVDEPCASCPVLEDCGGGCKVDEGCESGEFCIDRLIRGLSPELKLKLEPSMLKRFHDLSYPAHYRTSYRSRFLAVTRKYAGNGDLFFKTRYQTVACWGGRSGNSRLHTRLVGSSIRAGISRGLQGENPGRQTENILLGPYMDGWAGANLLT